MRSPVTSAPSFVCDFCFCFHFLHRSPARFGSKFVILWVNASGVPGNALLSGRLCSKSHLIPMRSPRARQWVGVREYRVYVFTCLRSASPAVDPQPGLEEPPPTCLAERERRGEGQTPELNLSLQIPPHPWERRGGRPGHLHGNRPGFSACSSVHIINPLTESSWEFQQ